MTEKTYPVPTAIRDAAKHGELVVFVGSGVSVLCGSPNWEGFANAVIDVVGKPAKLSFLEIEQLRAISDPRRRLSIAIDLAEKARVPVDYEAILHPERGGKGVGLEAYRLLSALNPVFITTNYDKWFDTAPPPVLSGAAGAPNEETAPSQRKIIVGRDQLNTDLLFNRGAVFHLHGRCTDPRSMVISLRQYISHYSDPHVIAFLREIFSKWTVLFVGYSLSELEILEYVIKAASPDGSTPPTIRHHILYGYRTSESAQTRFIERYFEHECNVGVIKFKIDENGWDELLNVLKEWQPQIDVRDASTIEIQTYLNRCIEGEEDPTRRNDAIRFISRWTDLQPYFFNSISNPAWFDDLDDAGLFDPATNAPPIPERTTEGTVLYSAPRWAPGSYLERVAPKVVGPQAENLMRIVRAATDDAERRGIDNWLTNWNLAKAFASVQLEVLHADDARLVRSWLKTNFNADMIARPIGLELLPRLLAAGGPNQREIALGIIAAITACREDAGDDNRHQGVVGDYWVREVVHASASALGRRCGEEAVAVLCRSLENSIGTPDDDARHHWWRSAIETHEQDRHHDDLRSSLVDAVRDATLGCIAENPEAGRRTVTALLRSPYSTLVRIGIYVCGERFGDVGDLFWTEFQPSWFRDTAYWHEVYWFLHKGFSRFSALQRQRYLDEVDNFHGDWRNADRSDEYDNRHRVDLLHPTKGQGDEDVDARYSRLTAEYGQPREHVDFHVYSSMAGWVGERSPASAVELSELTPERLLVYLREFQPDGEWDHPTRRGLADALSELVRSDDEAFASRLASFVDVLPAYQHGVLNGLSRRWADKNEIDWDASLTFASEVLAAPGFVDLLRADDGSSDEPSARWVTTDILDLINTGIAEDDRAIPAMLLPIALQIAMAVIGMLPPNPAEDTSNVVSDAINNPRGRALELTIRLLLHASRTAPEGTDPPIGWGLVSELFDQELRLSEVGKNADFAAHAGVYISNLHYLAPEWVEQNFNRLFSLANREAWSCAAQGFAYQRYSYDWLYTRLRAGGHLGRMLTDESLPDSVTEKTLQFIMLAYLAGREPLAGEDAELVDRILQEMKPDVISRLCWFVWTMHGNLNHAQRDRIREFWLAASTRIYGHEDDYAIPLSGLNLLASTIQSLDEDLVRAWKQAAPYARDAHHDSHFVEDLARLAPTNPREVGEIFLAALQRFVPSYDEQHIISCVRSIARGGYADMAEQICQIYAEKGSTLLHQTYLDIRARNFGDDTPGY